LSGGSLDEALAVARTITEPKARAEALGALAPQLPEHERAAVLAETVAGARVISDRRDRAAALGALAKYLPDELLVDALAATRRIANDWERTELLKTLAPFLARMPAPVLYALWLETLSDLAVRGRTSLQDDLQALIPVITALGTTKALVSIADAVVEARRWFP
jgi:hypothetical protein